MLKVIELLKRNELFPKYQGLIYQKEQDGLLLLNYTPECQYSRSWDEVTKACRGLIVDTRDFSVAALPFPKFFNLGDREETKFGNLPISSFSIFQKIDGSLGIMYRDVARNKALATRGAFASEQALCGTEMLRKLPGISEVPDELTLLFEIVYSANRSAIKYDFEGLVLLTAFNRFTGEELGWDDVAVWARRLGARLPEVYSFGSLEEAMEQAKLLPANIEGFVIRFENGLRVKLKGESYLALHKLVWGVTESKVYELLVERKLAELLRKVPEEFRLEIEAMAAPLVAEADRLKHSAEEHFAVAPKSSRKEFAIWTQSNAPEALRGALFQLMDGRTPNWYKFIQR